MAGSLHSFLTSVYTGLRNQNGFGYHVALARNKGAERPSYTRYCGFAKKVLTLPSLFDKLSMSIIWTGDRARRILVGNNGYVRLFLNGRFLKMRFKIKNE